MAMMNFKMPKKTWRYKKTQFQHYLECGFQKQAIKVSNFLPIGALALHHKWLHDDAFNESTEELLHSTNMGKQKQYYLYM